MADWIKEWAIPLSAGVTLLLAIAAFWAIWQNYSFRKEDREREHRVRSSEELYKWAEESLRLFHLPYNYHKDEIYEGLIELVSKSLAATTAAIIVGDEFIGLTARTVRALTRYYSEIKARRQKNKQVDKLVFEEFQASFGGLIFYLNLLRTWDYDYDAFIKEVKAHGALPISQHLRFES